MTDAAQATAPPTAPPSPPATSARPAGDDRLGRLATATTAAEVLKVTMRMPIHDLLAALRESGLSDGSRCVWCHADEAWATSAVYWACRDCGHRGTIVELAWSVACTPRSLERAVAAANRAATGAGERPADVAHAEGGGRA